MSLLNAYHGHLTKILDEEIESQRSAVLMGNLEDIAQYKYRVGLLHGLEKLRELSDEAMKEVNDR